MQIYNSGSGGQPYFLIDDGTTQASMADTGVDYADGAWHNVTVTVDRSGNATMYIDGDQRGTASVSSLASVNTNDHDTIEIGRYWTSDNYYDYMDGLIDEVMLFNYSLTATQVKSIVTQGQAAFN
ncbi:MAG: LamG domain-containing protein [Patescibacteria group bacterium]